MSYLPNKKEVEVKLIDISSRMMEDTTYKLVDDETGEEYTADNNIPVKKSIRLKSGYEDWKYWNGVSYIAFKKLHELFGTADYKSYVKNNFNFTHKVLPYFKEQYHWFNPKVYNPNFHQYFRCDRLDDCGAMGASLIETLDWVEKGNWIDYIHASADYILNKQDRLDDGTFCRKYKGYTTLWADDIYMSVPFLVRMGKLTNEKKYWDDAIKNTLSFHEKLFSKEKGLYYHSWCKEIGHTGVALWGRANGWSIVAKCDLLETIPHDYPGWEEVRKTLLEQIIGVSRYQSESGMWHQLLDKTDSFQETSATSMFTYAVAKAVNEGWIPEVFTSIAIRGWEGILPKIRQDGQVEDISEGFNIRQDLSYYYKRPRPLNDPHGLGTVLLAGVEIFKLKDYLDYIWY